jgi:hypothetical protein
MSVQSVVAAGSLLLQNDKGAQPTSDLKTLLLGRLSQYRVRVGLLDQDDSGKSLEDVQRLTANEALAVLERVQRILNEDKPETTPCTSDGKAQDGLGDAPSIGTRDITYLRMLISIVFKWGTEPLLSRIHSAWPSAHPARASGSKTIVHLDDVADNCDNLKSITLRLYAVIFPQGVQGGVPQTPISSTLLNRHPTDLLRPALVLGWIPKTLSHISTVLDEVRLLAMRLLSM